jgi:hypothetical protein
VTDDKPMTYADLKAAMDRLTPEQLAQPVVWAGDEQGGHVKSVWIAEEDWIGDSSDGETWMPRSTALKDYAEDYEDAEVCLAIGTVHLMVD